MCCEPGHTPTKSPIGIDASPNHRFVLLSTRETPIDPSLPRLRLNRLTTAFAQKLAAGYITLNQQNGFRQLLREKAALVETSQLAYLTIGMELLRCRPGARLQSMAVGPQCPHWYRRGYSSFRR